ncbi:hypothetical protein BWK58_11365 [Flavobacterium columnare]|nr:hypothetical protein BWK58_11365 [Flavobacterium columnare]
MSSRRKEGTQKRKDSSFLGKICSKREAVMGTINKKLGCETIIINGVEDHVHFLMMSDMFFEELK